jgi:hypothetical protein
MALNSTLHLHARPKRLITAFCGAAGVSLENGWDWDGRPVQPCRRRWPACLLTFPEEPLASCFLSIAENIAAPQTAGRSSLSFSLQTPPPPVFAVLSLRVGRLVQDHAATPISHYSQASIPLLSPSRLYPSFSCYYYRLGTRHQDSSACGGSGILGSPFRHLDLWRGSRVP